MFIVGVIDVVVPAIVAVRALSRTLGADKNVLFGRGKMVPVSPLLGAIDPAPKTLTTCAC